MSVDHAELERRVRRGAALLDEKCPGWWGKVDLGRLDISDPYEDVLGQLYGDYNKGKETIGIDGGADSRLHGMLGFTEEYPVLNSLWVSEVRSRSLDVNSVAASRLVSLEAEVARLRGIVERDAIEAKTPDRATGTASASPGLPSNGEAISRLAGDEPVSDPIDYCVRDIIYNHDSMTWTVNVKHRTGGIHRTSTCLSLAISKAINDAFDAGRKDEAMARADLYHEAHPA